MNVCPVASVGVGVQRGDCLGIALRKARDQVSAQRSADTFDIPANIRCDRRRLAVRLGASDSKAGAAIFAHVAARLLPTNEQLAGQPCSPVRHR
jgi:hypothetical protein